MDAVRSRPKGLWDRVRAALRPLELLAGLFLGCVSVLLVVSLFLSALDKALHGQGVRTGYALVQPQIPNPVDLMLTAFSRAYPLDYVVFALLIAYIVYATMDGFRRIGIQCFCVRLFAVRPAGTLPRGILLVCYLLSLVVLALNTVLLTLTPQYATYGNQVFVQDGRVVACNTQAPPTECTLTRLAALTSRLYYGMAFVGAAFFWLGWLFFATFLYGAVRATCARHCGRSADGASDDADYGHVFDEADDEPVAEA